MENIESKINQALLSLEALVYIKETYNNNVSLHHSFVQDFNSAVDKQINITKMTINNLKIIKENETCYNNIKHVVHV